MSVDEIQVATKRDSLHLNAEHAEAADQMLDQPEAEQDAAALSAREQDHYRLIKEMERRCVILEEDFEAKNAEAKLAKKILEASVDALRGMIRKGPDAQQELPFDDSHLDVPIGLAIELTEKQAEKLAEAGVETVADFERLRAGTTEHPGGLRDIKGVGDALVDKWEEQILDWLTKNQSAEGSPEVASLEDDVAKELSAFAP